MNACAKKHMDEQCIENAMRILIVDDDNDLAISLKDMLEIQYADAEVNIANNIDATHQNIRSFSPDVVLIDIKLGADNGLDLVPFIKKAHPHSACIMMTAFRDTDYAIKALRVGADEYLLKPVNPTTLFSIISRVRKQKALERERDELDNRFKTLFENSFEFYFLLDTTGHIIDVNNTALTTTGVDKDRVLGTYIGNAPWWNNKNKEFKTINYALSKALKNDNSREEITVLNSGGDARIFDFSFKPVTDASGNIFLILAEGRDISERKQYEEKLSRLNTELEERVTMRTIALEKASRAKSEFLSRMSHELRTPLNIILGYAQILELKGEKHFAIEDREAIHEIHNAGDHLLELVTDILDLTRIEKNKLALTIKPVDLAGCFANVKKMMAIKASEQNKFISVLNGGKVSVMADKTRIRQVLVNLVNNALNYGGNIEISYTNSKNDMVRINVRDDGPGIDKSKQALLFVPFERLDEKTVDGAGIGLSICESLVHLMGGEIGVESTPGQGSIFWFELPVAK